MSRFRKIEFHLKQLAELQSIMASMKMLSQLELRKLGATADNQREMAQLLREVVDDYSMFFPEPQPASAHELLLVIGSERGFCGPFNELLVEHLFAGWPGIGQQPWRVLAVGRKLCGHLDERLPGCTPLAGAGTTEEIVKILPQVVSVVQRLMSEHSSSALRVLYHGDEPGLVMSSRLLPPERGSDPGRRFDPPVLYLEPSRFYLDFLEHYLYLGLIRLFTLSLLAENRYRVQHLGGAVKRLDDRLAVLRIRARALRQEEITEEIEMILLGSGAFDREDRGTFFR